MSNTTPSIDDPNEYPSGYNEEPLYSEDGVDLTLIQWMLSLTYTERLQVLQQSIDSIERLHQARFHD